MTLCRQNLFTVIQNYDRSPDHPVGYGTSFAASWEQS
jgi:hypothetical protein